MLDPRRNPRQLAAKRLDKSLGGRRAPGSPPGSGRSVQWLAVACSVLVLLIMAGRLQRAPARPTADATAPEAAPTALAPSRSAGPPPAAPMSPGPPATVATSTPTLDLLVQIEARRRIQRAGRSVYLDSLLAETDSMLRRWPERPGQPVTIALIRDSLYEAVPGADVIVREALAIWQGLPLGVEFTAIADTAAADIVVSWRDRFEPEERRTGQTDLEVGPDGNISHARLSLARRAPDNRPLDRQAMLITATHELGHALGLAHSDLPGDVMFPTPRGARLSDRDRQTALLIYGLPAGSVKGQ